MRFPVLIPIVVGTAITFTVVKATEPAKVKPTNQAAVGTPLMSELQVKSTETAAPLVKVKLKLMKK